MSLGLLLFIVAFTVIFDQFRSHFGSFWVVLGCFGPFWPVLFQFRFPFGFLWLILIPFGLFYVVLSQFRSFLSFWLLLVQFRSPFGFFSRFGSFWMSLGLL